MEMTKIKEVKERCINYDVIVNYPYHDDDLLTHQIINLYKDYVYSANNTECEIITCEIIDKIVKEYLDNYKFHNFIRKYYEEGNIDAFIIKDKIIELYDIYQNEHLKLVEQTKWL